MSQNNNNNATTIASQQWDKAALTYETPFTLKILTFYSNELLKRSDLSSLQKSKNNETDSNTDKNNVTQNYYFLDIATGTGILAFLLQNQITKIFNNSFDNDISQPPPQTQHLLQNYKIEGIDFSQGMIQIANQKKQQSNESVNFQVMNGMDLQFKDNTFDRIFSNFGIIFYPDIVKGLKEIYRVLKSNGGIAVVNGWTENHSMKIPVEIVTSFHTSLVNKINNKNNNTTCENVEKKVPDFLQLKNVNVFEKVCKEAGFENVKVEIVNYKLKVSLKEYIDEALIRLPTMPMEKEDFIERMKMAFGVDNNLEEIVTINLKATVATLVKQ